MGFFGYLYALFIIISGIYTAMLFYKYRPQYLLGQTASAFLAVWVVLAYYDVVDAPEALYITLLIIVFIVYWEGIVNWPLIKVMMQTLPDVNPNTLIVTSLISIAPFIYMAVNLLIRYF